MMPKTNMSGLNDAKNKYVRFEWCQKQICQVWMMSKTNMSGLNDVKNQINTHLQSILCIFTFTKMEFLVAYEDRHYKHGFSRYLTPLTTTKNISSHGTSLLSSHGTSLLSSHGTSLISSHGTSLISNHFKRRDNFLYHSVFSSITP
jgi:hypothetical protein